jgi:cytochrome o ubiquinol oxidase operon protein cyoD
MQVQAQGQAPGIDPHEQHGARSYLIGLGYAIALTGASFWASSTSFVYAPAVPVLLAALAIAQMGVHVAFFLHISSAPDQANNLLSLAFGVFVTGLVIFGSIMIMTHLDHNTMPMDQLMRMQR